MFELAIGFFHPLQLLQTLSGSELQLHSESSSKRSESSKLNRSPSSQSSMAGATTSPPPPAAPAPPPALPPLPLPPARLPPAAAASFRQRTKAYCSFPHTHTLTYLHTQTQQSLSRRCGAILTRHYNCCRLN